ncbi:TPA: SSU0592/SSU0593 family protein [Streptococcus suis]|nr:hypothetical protein [Streptococcus suis]NQJ42717.1 hypothetical protein [Streptococcus suis]HEM4378133.1 hypothetical protein [Streptococcus suis]HEM4430842.1 hypothetical protein [Streptococcus suis]
MKHIVTKRNYKVGACAMALALLMTTAGGAVVNANTHQSFESSYGFSGRGGDGGVFLKLKGPTESVNQGVGNVEPVNPPVTQMAPSEPKSWFGSFWGGVQRLWRALCCGLGFCPSR